MYSVSEVAKITGVSNVAIYKKLKKLKGLDEFVVIKEGKTYVLEAGLELIKQSLQVNNQFNTKEIEERKEDITRTEIAGNAELKEVVELNNKLINSLMEQLKVKDVQLEAKDKQIASQGEQILSLHKLIENSQVLLKEEKSRNEIKLITEESLKKHQDQLDEKLESIKEKMNSRKKKRRRWFAREKEDMVTEKIV